MSDFHVNYGTPVRTVRREHPFGGYMVWVEHEGVTGHERLQPDEQCECGVLGVGIIR